MYLSLYKLLEKPFNISTDPRFLWCGEKHQEALANLRYGLLEPNGYVILTGDVGTGKTTLVNALIDTLDDNVVVANINHPTLDIIDFFNLVAKNFDASAEITTKTEFLFFINSFLQKSYAAGKVVLLIIDEAHRLTQELLEEIRLLSNIEQAGTKLISIFFIGQNEFKELLLSPQCTALRQRITLFCEIEPLSEDETHEYIFHRLKVAGTEEQLFTPAAIREIQRFTRGYPRLINILCDRALLTGYVRGHEEIGADIIMECSREVSFLNPRASIVPTNQIDIFLHWGSSLVSRLRTNRADPKKKLHQENETSEIKGFMAKSISNVDHDIAVPIVKKNRLSFKLIGLVGLFALISVAIGINLYITLPVEDFETKDSTEVNTNDAAGIPVRKNVSTALTLPRNEVHPVPDRQTPEVSKDMSQTLKQDANKVLKENDNSTDSATVEAKIPPIEKVQKSEISADAGQPIRPQATVVAVENYASKDSTEVNSYDAAGISVRNNSSTTPTLPRNEVHPVPDRQIPEVPKDVSQTLKQDANKVLKEIDNSTDSATVEAKIPPIEKVQKSEISADAGQPINPQVTVVPVEETLKPHQPTTFELVSAALEQNNFQTAIDILEALQKRDNESYLTFREMHSKALVGRAKQLLATSPVKAESLLVQAAKVNPRNIEAHSNLGKIYIRSKDYALAIETYQDALTLNPKLSDALFNLGFIYATIGMYEDAEKQYVRLVPLEPPYLDKALFNLAMVQEKLGKKELCLANLKMAVSIRPENQKAQSQLKLLLGAVEEADI